MEHSYDLRHIAAHDKSAGADRDVGTADAANALQRLVSRPRKALPEGSTDGQADGYRLQWNPPPCGSSTSSAGPARRRHACRCRPPARSVTPERMSRVRTLALGFEIKFEPANLMPGQSRHDVPEGTTELALLCADPDAPNGPFVHWIVTHIAPDAAGGGRELGATVRLTGPQRLR